MTILMDEDDTILHVLGGQRFVDIVEKIPDKLGYTKTKNIETFDCDDYNIFKDVNDVNIDKIFSTIIDSIDDLQRFEIKGSHIIGWDEEKT
jgi:hypothetical protein